MLFLSILVVGLGGHESNLQTRLLDEFYKIIADQIVYQGQKRLELVQALIVTWMWIPPPARLEDIKLGLMAHLVASMVQDLKMKSTREISSREHLGSQRFAAGTGIQENGSAAIDDRTHLGSYVACTLFSLVLKRPTILPFTESVSKSLDSVRGSLEGSPTDRILVAWVELERIAIDLADAKSTLPNPMPSNFGSLKSWLARSFGSRLDNWKDSVTMDIKQDGAFHYPRIHYTAE